jgi:Flp pilus assembly protein TadG
MTTLMMTTMLQPSRTRKRSGAIAVEAAIVQPVMLFIMLGLIIGGMGVFRYQQVACQACEAARWACVRGSDWQKNTGQTSPTEAQILQQAVVPLAAGMDTKSLALQVLWVDGSTGQTVAWDLARKDPQTLAKTGDYVSNKVRVTITYQFAPGVMGLAALQLSSTCEFPMAF